MSRVLEVENLIKYFPYEKNFWGKTKSVVKAVDDVSFYLDKGETLAIVGESGCGKSSLVKTILGINKKDSGVIKLNGQDYNTKNLSKERRRAIQMIFQDPYSSLDPSMKVKDILSEGIMYHNLVEKFDLDKRLKELLEICGLDEDALDKYPREFSGGQRQRIGIARAISLNPEIIIADEPVSALDVSMQAQIVNLMINLQKEIGMSYIFISHDLSLVKYIASRVAIMYLGEIVEIGDKTKIYKNTLHPYTKLLMDSVPINHPRERKARKKDEDEGSIKDTNIDGCPFYKRCPHAMDICKNKKPRLKEVEENHFVKCHLV